MIWIVRKELRVAMLSHVSKLEPHLTQAALTHRHVILVCPGSARGRQIRTNAFHKSLCLVRKGASIKIPIAKRMCEHHVTKLDRHRWIEEGGIVASPGVIFVDEKFDSAEEMLVVEC
jgi:hypothetical protein